MPPAACAIPLLLLNLPVRHASGLFPASAFHCMAEALAEFFLANFRVHRDERAFGQRRGYRMQWFTYEQVLEMALRFSGELEARGIVKGDRVMLWGENCAEWVATFFGCCLRGVVVVPMDDGAAGDLAGRVSQQVEARLWVCGIAEACAAREWDGCGAFRGAGGFIADSWSDAGVIFGR